MIRPLLVAALLTAGPVFTVQDPRIDENSGMVDLGALTAVTNDSGDDGVVYVLDRRGRTVGTTRYGTSYDAEALAPAGLGHVWVGDIGDNEATRDHVVVRRVPVGRGSRTVSVPAYRLVYPDGPHDAETLLADPRSGRLYVVTKRLLGSTAYAAPQRLRADRDNPLRRVARVSLTPTDGAVARDGRHVVLRGYGGAVAYTFPGFRAVGEVPLPAQRQGESLTLGPGDRLRVGSEGLRQPVLQVRVPADVRRTLAATTPARADDTTARPAETDRVTDDGDDRLLLWSGLGVAVLAGAVAVGVRRRRG